jgi:hypothetical protein
VITITLSAADAAQHAIENPYLHPLIGEHRMTLTLCLLALLAAVFIRGFKEAIGLATIVCSPYLSLDLVVLGRCLVEVLYHPDTFRNWQAALHGRGHCSGIAIASALIFPRLALGLSGFETGVSVMSAHHFQLRHCRSDPTVRISGGWESQRTRDRLSGS